MRFVKSAPVIFVCALGGCGLANQQHSISWAVTLDHVPDIACAAAAIAALPEVAASERRDRPDGQTIAVRSKAWRDIASDRDGKPFPDIFVTFLHGRAEQFRLGFLSPPQPDDMHEKTAHAIVMRLTDACAMPESAKMRRQDDAVWMPYLFNI